MAKRERQQMKAAKRAARKAAGENDSPDLETADPDLDLDLEPAPEA